MNIGNTGGSGAITPEQKKMLELAAARLGISPEELARRLHSGNISSIASGNSQLAKVLGDKQAMERLMNSPQAKALLASLAKSQDKR